MILMIWQENVSLQGRWSSENRRKYISKLTRLAEQTLRAIMLDDCTKSWICGTYRGELGTHLICILSKCLRLICVLIGISAPMKVKRSCLKLSLLFSYIGDIYNTDIFTHVVLILRRRQFLDILKTEDILQTFLQIKGTLGNCHLHMCLSSEKYH